MYKEKREKNIVTIRWDGFPYRSPVSYVGNNISVFGYSPEEIQKEPSLLLKIRKQSEVIRLETALDKIEKQEIHEYESIYRAMCKTGSVILVTEITRYVKDEQGKLIGETLLVDSRLGEELGIKLKKLSETIEFSEEDQLILEEIEMNIVDEIVDLEGLREFMKVFCDVHNVIAYSINSTQDIFIKLAGSDEDEAALKDLFGEQEYLNKLIDVFIESQKTKEVTWYETEHLFVKMASIPLVVAGHVKASILFSAIIRDSKEKVSEEFKDARTIDNADLEKSAILLSYLSQKLGLAVTNSVNYYVENIKRKEANAAVIYGIRKNETFARIVQLLESEQEFEGIVYVLLETIGDFLDIRNALITRVESQIVWKL
jgi:hypothetical protein